MAGEYLGRRRAPGTGCRARIAAASHRSGVREAELGSKTFVKIGGIVLECASLNLKDLQACVVSFP